MICIWMRSIAARYEVINRDHWNRLERGEITKEEVKVGRFRVLLVGTVESGTSIRQRLRPTIRMCWAVSTII